MISKTHSETDSPTFSKAFKENPTEQDEQNQLRTTLFFIFLSEMLF